MGGIGHNYGLACSTSSGLDEGYFLCWDGTEMKRVMVTKVTLGGKGGLGDVLKRFDIIWFDPTLMESLSVKGDMFIKPPYCLLKETPLGLFKLLPRGGLHFFVPICRHRATLEAKF